MFFSSFILKSSTQLFNQLSSSPSQLGQAFQILFILAYKKVSILQIGNTIPKNDIEKKEKYWNRNQASIVPRAKLMIFTTFSLHHFLVFVLEPASIIMFAFHFVQNYGIFNHGHKNTKCTTESPNFDHSNTSILRSSMLDSSICVHHDQIQCYQKTHASRDLKISVIKYYLVIIENNRS